MIDGYAWRRDREQEDRTYYAWLVASLGRAKKIPKVDKLMKKKKQAPGPEQQSSQDELIAAAKAKGLKGPWDK